MYFATFQTQDQSPAIGLVVPNKNALLPLRQAQLHYCRTATLPDSMLEFISQHDAIATVRQIIDKLDGSCPLLPLSDITLLAPIPRPAKNIFCVGKNYVAHALEFEKDKHRAEAVPTAPVIFSKPPTAVIGPHAVINSHNPIVSQLDYEVELAVIIGAPASKVSKEDAWQYVFGYTIMNDITARDLQKKHSQWLLGKGGDTFAPLGPWIAHKSVVPHPHQLAISCTVNGQIRQQANTAAMIFDIPTLIATLSAVITLEPGDIIATGTPAGVGAAMDPPQFLQPGDEIRLEIEQIGVLCNTVA